MDEFLFRKDKEFSEMNAELDLKANILLKEAESLMRYEPLTNECVINADGGADEVLENSILNECEELSSAGNNTATRTKEGSLLGPAAWSRGVNTEPELRFLRAKLKILTTELERQQSEQHQKLSEWRTREGELRTLREEKDKATQQIACANQQVVKLSATLAERSERLQRMEAANSKLTTELHAVKKEAKTATHRANTLELRLNRLVEESETLRTALHNTRQQEKEEREEQRKKLDKHAACAQRTERQRNELALAFRRQMMLCHNLQQQKELLMAGAAVQAAETQFDQILAFKNNKQ